MKPKIEDVIIVGGGPAGIAAAIQLKRYGYSPALLERKEVGGLLHNANLVENYPGFPDGIRGPELVQLFRSQLDRLSIIAQNEDVLKVEFHDGIFQVTTGVGERFSRILVLASGTVPRRFTAVEIPNSMADRITYEVYPLLGETGKSMAVIGAGDAAFDYGLNLSRHNQVHILNRTKAVKCLPLLWERAKKNPSIVYHENTRIQRISEDEDGRIVVKCESDVGTSEFRVDHLVAAIGRVPNVDMLSGNIEKSMDDLTSDGLLCIIGDVKNQIFRQTSISVGDGVRAAMQIYLNSEEGKLK